jgi:methyl-accepting chemotaxis protein
VETTPPKRLVAPDARAKPRTLAPAAASSEGTDRTGERRAKAERRAPAAANDEWEEF